MGQMMGLESGSSRKRAGRSSSEHFEETKNSLHYSKDYKLNHSHHHQQLQKKSIPIFALHPNGSLRRSCQTIFATLRSRIGLTLDASPCYHLSQFLWTCQNGLKTVLMASKTYNL